jgi:hypothetical protein
MISRQMLTGVVDPAIRAFGMARFAAGADQAGQQQTELA